MLKAIFFDYGDTLVEYKPEWAEERWQTVGHECAARCCRLLSEHGRGEVSPAEFYQAYLRIRELYRGGWRRDEPDSSGEYIFQEVLKTFNICVDMALLSQLVNEAYAPIAALARLAEGVPEILREFKRQGLKLGVVSNSPLTVPARLVLADMRRLGRLDRYFDVLVFSADGYRRKPHPEMFHRALAQLKVAPSAALFVGDEPATDVVGAQQVGMKVVLKKFPWKRYGADIVPDFEVDRLTELPHILQEFR